MSMTNMKFDCGGRFYHFTDNAETMNVYNKWKSHALVGLGAAAVLGAVQALAELEPEHVQVHFLIAACENMINERAMVPGDILVASNGKTIEVGNTDAEGRLSMADALVYADQHLACQEILELSNVSVSASGTYHQGSHIFDPRTGKNDFKPIFERVWVAASSAGYSDAFSTAFFILTLPEIEEILQRNDQILWIAYSIDGKLTILEKNQLT